MCGALRGGSETLPMKRSLTRVFMLLGGFALVAASAAQTRAQSKSESGQNASQTPTVQGVLDPSRSAVFASPQQSCNSNDIPDAMARAFRDKQGMIHLTAASSARFRRLRSVPDSRARAAGCAAFQGHEAHAVQRKRQLEVACSEQPRVLSLQARSPHLLRGPSGNYPWKARRYYVSGALPNEFRKFR